ncbi:tRNA (adenosine(37)-N6)-dimethylallyltransferase MiaA [Mucisphaera calidilacus]|uniref:tRNA dimethylallyltransferase n=1 Tax=Mucisphaera calidilacus TaxID=2527982 RepID=A0A518BZT6_9BACT|nr:tRNA (adenosine(37)-N6)-dimethylallyltransferase MiaA [Mucisphaera calidilacus]QDU72486.1 IPP transferase [Mucisphaera calidilacus]
MSSLRPIVILGPTAGGKSELAVRLGEALGGEVINADSMQVYRHMDAGTAKPTHEQRSCIPHHLIDCAEPDRPYTVSNWLDSAEACLSGMQHDRKRPIVAGGTNLYLKSLLHGMFQGPGTDETYRASLGEQSSQDLHTRLADIDPPAAERIAPADRKRIVRALEVHHLTGMTITEHQSQWSEDPDRPYRYDPVLIGLSWPTDAINARINLRVKAMFYPHKFDELIAREVCIGGRSLPEETADLEARGLLGMQAREALGTKQVLEHLADPSRFTLDDAYEKTKVHTRRFGKQQRTWMRRFRGVRWIEMHPEISPGEVAEQALALIEAAENDDHASH